MDPSLQPRAKNLYEKFATNAIGELYLMQALIKFYAGEIWKVVNLINLLPILNNDEIH